MKTFPEYIAGEVEYLYPAAGDPAPTPGAKVQLLTIGGVHTTGAFDPSFCRGWFPLPKRNMKKEEAL